MSDLSKLFSMRLDGETKFSLGDLVEFASNVHTGKVGEKYLQYGVIHAALVEINKEGVESVQYKIGRQTIKEETIIKVVVENYRENKSDIDIGEKGIREDNAFFRVDEDTE